MTKFSATSLLALTLLTATAIKLQAQEGTPTQALVNIDSQTPAAPTPQNLTLKVDSRTTPLTNLAAIPPTGAQIALLIDDGLRVSVGRELATLRKFVQTLPRGTEIFIGYMQNGRVVPAHDFTTNYAAAAQSIRTPLGSAGISASPYFCLSDFVKQWPSAQNEAQRRDPQPELQAPQPTRKARFVLMITNGVDPYNGSTSIQNQNSPYVATAVTDAQRAGVPVYSIYFSDAGFGGERSSFSGQSYLTQLADGTGGTAYYQGTGNPVSMEPFLKKFQSAVAETYIATFPAPTNKDFVRIKLSTSLPKTKLHAPDQVRPGTRLNNAQTNPDNR